jgi:hypothetical protein
MNLVVLNASKRWVEQDHVRQRPTSGDGRTGIYTDILPATDFFLPAIAVPARCRA